MRNGNRVLSMSLLMDTELEKPKIEALALGLRLRATAHEQLLLAMNHLAREGDALHTGIHQARKCIRRVRAILALGMRKLDPRAQRLDAQLGQLGRGMSRLRDAQALIEALHRLDGDAPDDVRMILPEAEAAARQRRDALLAEALTRDPQFLSRRRRLRTMSDRLLRLNWQPLHDAEAVAAILRSERRVEKAGRKASRHRDRDEDWHVLRRRMRRLRQQDTVLANVCPEVRTSMHGLEHRADALGHSQDDTLVVIHCGRKSPFTLAQRTVLRRVARERLRHARHG
jgi:CHAD domain